MAKKQITLKQVGQNLIVIIDGKQLSKKFEDKTQREFIKSLVEEYNTKNTAKTEKAIINALTPETIKTKEIVKKATKANDKINKARSATNKKVSTKKELSVTDIEKPKKLGKEKVEELATKLASHKKTEIPKENKPVRRSGEH